MAVTVAGSIDVKMNFSATASGNVGSSRQDVNYRKQEAFALVAGAGDDEAVYADSIAIVASATTELNLASATRLNDIGQACVFKRISHMLASLEDGGPDSVVLKGKSGGTGFLDVLSASGGLRLYAGGIACLTNPDGYNLSGGQSVLDVINDGVAGTLTVIVAGTID